MKKIFIRLFKIVSAFSVLIILSLGIYAWNFYSDKKTLLVPYPYYFNIKATQSIQNELRKAEEAQILIMGDRMGTPLSNYTQELSQDLGKNYKSPPKIYNWASPHEGLHRTLFKLKSLNKIPSIIIYLGASSEMFEKTFSVEDYYALKKNFHIFDDEKLISLIITFPWLSKVLYHQMNFFELGDIKEYKNQLPSNLKMKEKEISFLLFEHELREMSEYIREKKSSLILITTPINFEIPPREICSSSSSASVIEAQQEIDSLLNAGNFKKALTLSQALSDETTGNARSFFLLGKSALGSGNLSLARESFNKASVFDCANWRGNAVYNSIIRREAQSQQQAIIDFDLMISSALSKDGLFLDEFYPQNLFYQNLLSDLKKVLQNYLNGSE